MILLIGGTGKIGVKVARLLREANITALLTSRSGNAPAPYHGVQFNWFDKKTYENPFQVADKIDRVYLVGPPILDMLPLVKEFIHIALDRGVTRFVLVCGTAIPKGAPGMGKVHEYIDGLGVECCALQPTWFIDNFGEQFLEDIRDRNEIPTFTGEGKVAFVSADDNADVAFDALTADSIKNTERVIVGPELYTYTEVATLLSEILERKIVHRHLSRDEARSLWKSAGVDDDYADVLVDMEKFIADGEEEAFFHRNDKVVGKRCLRDYFVNNREVWIKN